MVRTAAALPYARALLECNPHNPEARRPLDVALAGCGEASKVHDAALRRAGTEATDTLATAA